MIKRSFDIAAALLGLAAGSIVLVPAMLAVWLQDFRSPLYKAPRMGRDGRPFRMVKIRSMVSDADRTGVDSTSSRDARITRVGRIIRAYKLDELSQLWNVLTGEMSLVGPRPNVERETRLYTDVEKRLLSVRPGITDIASIVFADEGEILDGCDDPDIAYNQLIRPWKSRLGLFYIDHASFGLDLRIIGLTALAMVSRRAALTRVGKLLATLGAGDDLQRIADRGEPLAPLPPPGADTIVASREPRARESAGRQG